MISIWHRLLLFLGLRKTKFVTGKNCKIYVNGKEVTLETAFRAISKHEPIYEPIDVLGKVEVVEIVSTEE